MAVPLKFSLKVLISKLTYKLVKKIEFSLMSLDISLYIIQFPPTSEQGMKEVYPSISEFYMTRYYGDNVKRS